MATGAPVGFHPGLKSSVIWQVLSYAVTSLFQARSKDDYFAKTKPNNILGRNSEAPFEIMRLFTEAGGNAEKACVGHIESNIIVIF